ncbi:sulfite exporter TauE/SafE family protein [Gramella jeungdoensis]|uniref:Sulfite exporter TauE/SafE family protein n=1 Tax=Gramella jeungdoensis TaxID=708091 RepID=A0ABT0Z143_9FLAO|nr:sulfite exporter TauE/SafE family protein [Gramella jeungdoensis]MCM8569289.1 sulfite exporter TauE/SafE family protein [Gramella jeungdoensis]
MLVSALIFGLLGSFHCMGMCGPIAFLLPVDRQNSIRKFLQIMLYHLGRITSYSIIGVAFGLVGKSLSLFGLQQQLSIIIGVLMLVFLMVPSRKLGGNKLSAIWMKSVGKLKNSLGRELRKKRLDTFFSVGFLNGFLPCGLVYMAVFGAIASGNAANGALYMMLFGLGTIPLMTGAIWIGNFISVNVRKYIRRMIPLFLGIIAVMFIIRGLGLGIPYLSPKQQGEKISANYECQPTN